MAKMKETLREHILSVRIPPMLNAEIRRKMVAEDIGSISCLLEKLLTEWLDRGKR